jgi:hypothetical protein
LLASSFLERNNASAVELLKILGASERGWKGDRDRAVALGLADRETA